MTAEPRTDAGKRLDVAWPGSHLDRLSWREAIVAIENEARSGASRGEAPPAHEHEWWDADDDETAWHCRICGLTEYPGDPGDPEPVCGWVCGLPARSHTAIGHPFTSAGTPLAPDLSPVQRERDRIWAAVDDLTQGGHRELDQIALHDAIYAPERAGGAPPSPQTPSLDAAWKAAEAALPEGWIVAGVDHAGPSPMMRREFVASAWGPWLRSSRSVDATYGYGDSPITALTDLVSALAESGAAR